MFACLKSSNIEGNMRHMNETLNLISYACRSASDLISVDAKYCFG